jgi:hypothetical protein
VRVLNKSFVFIGLWVLICIGCDTRFEAEPDKSDYIIYERSGGELGSSWVKIIIHGDGSGEYYGKYQYEGTWPQKETSKTFKLTTGRTKQFFQSLIDARLFSLKDKSIPGADLPFTAIRATIDDHTMDISWNIITDSDSYKKYSGVNELIWNISQEIGIPEPIMYN